MGKPIVAIVGRPNVGKSTLFNKLVGQRLAIVEDTPGVTRDRLYGNCEWQDHRFLLIDTGGIEPKADDVLLRHMRGQAQLAIDTADAILFVTDIRSGVTAQDQDIAAMLMRSGKPVFLVVNKVDGVGEPPMELYDFYSLGIGEPYPVSSVHGHGTGDLLEAVCACLPGNEDGEDEDERIGVAVIGRPNVGKSSLVNHILGEERMIVANEAGTTGRGGQRCGQPVRQIYVYRHCRPAQTRQSGGRRGAVQRAAQSGGRGARQGVCHHDRRHRGLYRAGF